MQQKNGEARQAPRRHAPTSKRFWYVVLAGTLVTLSYDLLPLLRGQLSPLVKLIVPGLLLAGQYRCLLYTSVLPSWPRKPWECAEKRLRGWPASTSAMRRRARASCMAAERPAKLPPMMTAS